MWDLIDELVRDGTTTVLTTQYLDEAERLADRIAVIDRGRVIAEGTADELKQEVGGTRLSVTATGAEPLGAMADALVELPMVVGTPRIDALTSTVSVSVSATDGLVAATVRLLDAKGIDIRDVDISGPTLDDVFLELTGRPADDHEDGPAGPVPAAASNGVN